jgi:predicted phage-related endonuclease
MKLYFKTEEEWLDYKKKVHGGTAASTIVHLNKYQSRIGYYRQCKGIDPPIEQSYDMLRGQFYEPAVAKEVEYILGCQYTEDNDGYITMLQHNEYDFIASSPDRMFIMDGKEYVLEIKTTKIYYQDHELPKSWIIQGLLNTKLAGLDDFAIAWHTDFITGTKIKFFNMDDTIVYNGIEYTLSDFYDKILTPSIVEFQGFLDSDTPPPAITGEEFEKYIEPKEEAYYADEKDLEVVWELIKVKEELSALDKKEKYIRSEIKKLIGNYESMRYIVDSNHTDNICSFRWGKRWKTVKSDAPDEKGDEYSFSATKKKVNVRTLLINTRASIFR